MTRRFGIRNNSDTTLDENEKLYPAKQAVERLNTIAPQIRTEIIPGAGHDLTLVQAALVNKTVLDFLVNSTEPSR
jgi:pimeloyl-ACP methyl ester carboxylesterase